MKAYPILLSLLLSSLACAEESWQDLLDPDLSKWEIFMGIPHKTVEIPGVPPSESEDCTKGTPLGLNNDPLRVFTTSEVDGEIRLSITGQIYGGLTSKEEYSNYHLKLEFRWGEKKWEPRLKRRRDSGVLIHCVGEHGTFWNVWMSSLECQVQEHDTGDFIALAGASAMVRTKPTPEDETRPTFSLDGEAKRHRGYINAGVDADKPNGEWNKLEIYAVGDEAVFVVNGTVNMVLSGTQFKGRPLTRGKIQIQSEAAEIEYRRIMLRPISAMPESF